MFFLPGIVIWLPAFQLNQAEKTAGHIGLILTGTVDKTSLGHLRDSATMSKKETATSNVSSADNEDGRWEPEGHLWTACWFKCWQHGIKCSSSIEMSSIRPSITPRPERVASLWMGCNETLTPAQLHHKQIQAEGRVVKILYKQGWSTTRHYFLPEFPVDRFRGILVSFLDIRHRLIASSSIHIVS